MTNPADNSTRTAPQVVARIRKGRGCELRVMLTTWRGATKLEIADYTASVPGVFMRCGAGVTLHAEHIDALIDALTKAAGAAARGVQK